jgi:hypothetical protein
VLLTVFAEDSTETNNLEMFDPPWPKRILRVRPLDGYGEQFTPIKDNCDSFVAWTLLGCVMCIPPLWSIVSKGVKGNNDPKGYLMSMAWSLQIKAEKGQTVQTNKKFFPQPKNRSERKTAMGVSNAN